MVKHANKIHKPINPVAFVFDGFGKGGAQRALLTILPLLMDKIKTPVDLIILRNSDDELEIRVPGNVNVIRLHAVNFFDLRAMMKLFHLLRTKHYRCVVANLYTSQIWVNLMSPLRQKIVWIEHNTYANRTRMQWFLFRVLSYRTQNIVSVSDDVRQFLARHQIFSWVVHNPLCRPKNSIDSSSRMPHFLFAGRLNEQKNPQLAVKAFHQLLELNSKNQSQLHLWICGQGPEEETLRRVVSELKLEKRVTFTGNLDQEHLFDLMTRCKTLISTSLFEGFALVRLEAAAHGMCVVSTSTGGFQETLLSEGTSIGMFEVGPIAGEIAMSMDKSLDDFYWTNDVVASRVALVTRFEPEQIWSHYERQVLLEGY
jgi:glycosyltransferase involved in cell wall biosynthesis